MTAKLQTVLRQAQKGRYAVGAFNISDLEQAQAVVRAAVALHAPVIINTSEKAIAYAGLEELAAFVLAMAKKYPIPIVLTLDHGHELRLARACVDRGYTGIMFDASRLPFRQNVRRTAAIVRYAHRRQIGVEGELGQVKYPSEIAQDRRLVLTDPTQAHTFVRLTKVDAFAVAIGNAHGVPQAREHLDFTLLAQIKKMIDVPLVLHGASGTPPAMIRRAIHFGIAKINIDTDLRLAFSQALRRELRRDAHEFDPRGLLGPSRDAVMATVKKKIVLFGSRNKSKS
ncbi:MAG: class II fructose-bisphosphate aldolase [Candidatus Kerfeldbacteria bacterium]|nr:class II fructose-bisphosphate aldolase [Candidatus Kerfeldbacteria bacterium]